MAHSTGAKQLIMMICTNSPSKKQLHAGWFVSLVGYCNQDGYDRREELLKDWLYQTEMQQTKMMITIYLLSST